MAIDPTAPRILLDLHLAGQEVAPFEHETRLAGAASISTMTFGSPVRGRISANEGVWAAVIALRAPEGSRWNGRLIRPGDVIALEPRDGIVANHAAGVEVGVLTASPGLAYEFHAGIDRTRQSPLGRRLGPRGAKRVRAAYDAGRRAHSGLAWATTDDVIAALVDIGGWRSRPRAQGPERHASSQRIVATALEHLEMHRLWRVPLGELADVTGVSARRVQMAFQQVANVSPTAYMRARALQAVRDRLLDPRHRTANITGIALDHGFEHLGRFSSYYREMFGERPSATLRERYPNAA